MTCSDDIFGKSSDRGLIATLQEDPTQLERIANSFGWSLRDDKVTLLYRSPVDLYVDEWVYDVLDTIEAVGASRVLVDSLGDLQAASPDSTRFREYVYSLLHCRSGGGGAKQDHDVGTSPRRRARCCTSSASE